MLVVLFIICIQRDSYQNEIKTVWTFIDTSYFISSEVSTVPVLLMTIVSAPRYFLFVSCFLSYEHALRKKLVISTSKLQPNLLQFTISQCVIV